MAQNPRLGAIFALASASAYGVNTPFARFAHVNGIAATTAVPCRAGVLLVISALYLVLTGGRFAVAPAARPSLLALASATTVISIAYLASVAFISVSIAAVIFYTFPIQILLWSVASGREPADIGRFVIFAAAFTGLILVIGPHFTDLDWRGAALAAAASVAATVQFFAGARVSAHCQPVTALFWVQMMVLPASAALAIIIGSSVPPFSLEIWWPVIALSIAHVAAFVLQILALREAAPTLVSIFYNIEPVVTFMAAAVLLGERLSGAQYAGAIFVIAALVAARLHGQRRKRNEAA